MSWKPMKTASKDGTVIVLYTENEPEAPVRLDVSHAYYEKSEGHWDAVAEDVPFHLPFVREQATLLGWIEVPDGSPAAGMMAYRDGELVREPSGFTLQR